MRRKEGKRPKSKFLINVSAYKKEDNDFLLTNMPEFLFAAGIDEIKNIEDRNDDGGLNRVKSRFKKPTQTKSSIHHHHRHRHCHHSPNNTMESFNCGNQDDYLYNLKRLAEITLAYFNYQNSNITADRNGDHNDDDVVNDSKKLEVNSSKSNDNKELYQCWDCNKTYSTSSNLARHRQTHRSLQDKKAKRCEHCGKIYVSIPAYSMHVRTHMQNCKCSICGKCFSRPWLLQGHIRTHTGEKPFKCVLCEKAFADKSNLRAHIQTHSSIKPYICGYCGKAFTLKSYLYKHEESSCIEIRNAEDSLKRRHV